MEEPNNELVSSNGLVDATGKQLASSTPPQPEMKQTFIRVHFVHPGERAKLLLGEVETYPSCVAFLPPQTYHDLADAVRFPNIKFNATGMTECEILAAPMDRQAAFELSDDMMTGMSNGAFVWGCDGDQVIAAMAFSTHDKVLYLAGKVTSIGDHRVSLQNRKLKQMPFVTADMVKPDDLEGVYLLSIFLHQEMGYGLEQEVLKLKQEKPALECGADIAALVEVNPLGFDGQVKREVVSHILPEEGNAASE